MIKETLPTFETSLVEETDETTGKKTLKKITTEKEITVCIDTSLFAEQRWEANFPNNAKQETLFAYIERIQNEGKVDTVHMLSNLKALFCFLESDDIPNFKAFCQLFDMSNTKRVTTLIEKIKSIFELVLDSATSNSKN